jgi:hypothetical protein
MQGSEQAATTTSDGALAAPHSKKAILMQVNRETTWHR